MIVSAHEVVVGLVSHVGRRHRDIFVAGNIYALRVIHLVVGASGNWKPRDIAFAVVEYGGNVRRKHGLRMVIDRHGRVSPPQEGLRLRRPVVQLRGDL
ncbi:hypothetical protein D3C81_1608600 [compost metagenome]